MSVCKPCMSDAIKESIAKIDQSARTAQVLSKIKPCKDGAEIVMCGVKGTRPRSPYQEFVSQCMKAKKLKGFDPEAMKDCARRWREKQNG